MPIKPNFSKSSEPSQPPLSKLASGYRVEDQARSYLESQGLVFVEARFRCRVGELDLIFIENGELVFVEVRSRTKGVSWESALESVGFKKRRRLRLAIEYYLTKREVWISRHSFRALRIDILGYDGAAWNWLKDVELV